MKTLLSFFVACFLLGYTQASVQIINTIAGNGTSGSGGDGGAATAAQLNLPRGVAADKAGNVYIADVNNNRIRKVNSSGVISTFAGTGTAGYNGDGGQASAAQLNHPFAVAVDKAGNVYIADDSNYRVRKVNTSGVISTIAGNGIGGFSGDGGLATLAQLSSLRGVVVDEAGNVYIVDQGNARIRKVNTSGVISTFAGNGSTGFSGDGSQATAAQLNTPVGIGVDTAGNVYIADANNNRIRKVNTSGIISTIAGDGSFGFSGDGGQATSAQMDTPVGVSVDSAGNLYIADLGNQRIRKVSTAGIINTIAGTGTAGFSGDSSLATAAKLSSPWGVAVDTFGNVYIADQGNNRIRKIFTPASVHVSASQNNICAGTSVTFTATPTNGGAKPTYQWKVNGNNVGTDSAVYVYAPANGDKISCDITTGAPQTFSSDTITMVTNPVVKPTATVTVNPGTTVVSGQQTIFTANVTNAGANPKYQWLKNGVSILDATQSTYSAVAGTDFQNNDQFSVSVKNTDQCGDSVKSSAITMTITTGISNVANNGYSFGLYPNPNNGSFTLKGTLTNKALHTVTVEVDNTIGQRVYQQEFTVNSGVLEQQIELSKLLPAGNYFLKLSDGSSTVIRFTLAGK